MPRSPPSRRTSMAPSSASEVAAAGVPKACDSVSRTRLAARARHAGGRFVPSFGSPVPAFRGEAGFVATGQAPARPGRWPHPRRRRRPGGRRRAGGRAGAAARGARGARPWAADGWGAPAPAPALPPAPARTGRRVAPPRSRTRLHPRRRRGDRGRGPSPLRSCVRWFQPTPLSGVSFCRLPARRAGSPLAWPSVPGEASVGVDRASWPWAGWPWGVTRPVGRLPLGAGRFGAELAVRPWFTASRQGLAAGAAVLRRRRQVVLGGVFLPR